MACMYACMWVHACVSIHTHTTLQRKECNFLKKNQKEMPERAMRPRDTPGLGLAPCRYLWQCLRCIPQQPSSCPAQECVKLLFGVQRVGFLLRSTLQEEGKNQRASERNTPSSLALRLPGPASCAWVFEVLREHRPTAGHKALAVLLLSHLSSQTL